MTIRGATATMLIVALAACASTPADEDPVQIQLKDLETRLARIERVMANQSLLDMANQQEALRADLRAMHNDIDELSNNLEASRKQTRDLYADLDQRMRNLEARGGASSAAASAPAAANNPAAPAASPAADSSASGTDDKAVYQTAFNLLKDGQYDKAIIALQNFLAAYPSSSLADNGQYWLGEAYYVNKDFTSALSSFQRVVDKYPQSRKLPDALLKIGYCRYEMKQFDSAKAILTQVATQYGDTPAGHLAQQRLEKMAAEKH